jgi:hypothetical protein
MEKNMSQKRKLAALLAVLVAVAIVAVTSVSNGAGVKARPTVLGLKAKAASVVSTFSSPLTSPAEIAARKSFEASLRKTAVVGDPSVPSEHADLEEAKPAPIAGSSQTAWIAPEGENICAFIPNPATGGYGSSCYSPAQITAGKAIVFIAHANGGPNSTVTYVQILANGASGPSVTTASGATSQVAVQSNVAAAALPATDTVSTGLGSVRLSSFTNR